MIPNPYPLRPSDRASVPTVSGVDGITSPLPTVPPAGVLGPSSRSVLGTDPGEGVGSPHGRTVSVYHPRSTHSDKRRPLPGCPSDAHQMLYTPPRRADLSLNGDSSSGDE